MKFRKIDLSIRRKSGYGQYQIEAVYKGKEIKVHTTNSECFDWLNDDSNKEKHQEAKRYAYNAVKRAYEEKYCYNSIFDENRSPYKSRRF